MKNYLALLSEIEIKNYIIEYLKNVGYNSTSNSIDKIEDISIERVNNHVEMAIYFQNDLKNDIHDEIVMNGLEFVRVSQSFGINPFEVFSYNLYPNEIESFMYLDSLNVDDDITTYWNYKMYEKFGKEYINDLRKYQLDDYYEISNLADKINEEYENESNKIIAENGFDL